MTYVITSACIGTRDQSCIEVCPVDCIHDVGEMLLIDPVECIDCGACEPECPVEAICHEAAVPESEQELLAINAVVADGVERAAELVSAFRERQASYADASDSSARRTGGEPPHLAFGG